MDRIEIKIAARTNPGLVRENNEDNLQVLADVASNSSTWTNDAVITLGAKGSLLVVADGMGGMNAGEVASEIAVNTIRELFASEAINDDVLASDYSINRYLKKVIVEADARIKAEAKRRPETRGMGTTAVIAWLLGKKLYVAWCGDSRAYLYNPRVGLKRVSKDHSYVQSLVDKGSLTEDEAFDFPDSNIITRCLGDSPTKAQPEAIDKPITLCDGDIVMLCSDGLCGLVRDRDIETVMESNTADMNTCVAELIEAACNGGGHDNITVAVGQVISGCGELSAQQQVKRGSTSTLDENAKAPVGDAGEGSSKKLLMIIGGILAACAIAAAVWFAASKHFSNNNVGVADSIKYDTIIVEKEVQAEKVEEDSQSDAGDILDKMKEANKEMKERQKKEESQKKDEAQKKDDAKSSDGSIAKSVLKAVADSKAEAEKAKSAEKTDADKKDSDKKDADKKEQGKSDKKDADKKDASSKKEDAKPESKPAEKEAKAEEPKKAPEETLYILSGDSIHNGVNYTKIVIQKATTVGAVCAKAGVNYGQLYNDKFMGFTSSSKDRQLAVHRVLYIKK